ncbi:MAG: hypothetical protein JWM96_1302 [Alphaproteobacteria bacterium]|nr:hypothetical protein [Alphaproteobacteria bacterium]
MATKTWKSISKFRLFTIVALSLLTSLSLTLGDELWTLKDVVSAVMQAAIAGFAFLQCPTISKTPENRQGES